MARVLIQFAHPFLSKSVIQKTLLKHAHGVQGVTVNDLYESYPDLYIDVEKEQNLLLAHDIIIFQHPFYWYSSPAIIKQWQDLVLEYDWAYGHNGNMLRDKKMFNAISCGGGKKTYGPGGYNHYAVNDFLLPFKQTAQLCKMEYMPPFVVHSSFRITDEAVRNAGRQYAAILEALVNDDIAPEHYRDVEYLNEVLPSASEFF
ncbi:MAG: NAD(P)H-dependent oxidoreductase [Bacteroidetes bacterium]|nr:NAD(P)H-dependent oxidoreductase [Bacteroidota bacterium]